MDLLYPLTERVQQLGEVDRCGILALIGSTAARGLIHHGLCRLPLQRLQDGLVYLELHPLLIPCLRLLLEVLLQAGLDFSLPLNLFFDTDGHFLLLVDF